MPAVPIHFCSEQYTQAAAHNLLSTSSSEAADPPGRGAEGGGQGLDDVGHEGEGQLAHHQRVQQEEDHEAVQRQADQHRDEVHAELSQKHRERLQLQDLGGDQETHADRRQPDGEGSGEGQTVPACSLKEDDSEHATRYAKDDPH